MIHVLLFSYLGCARDKPSLPLFDGPFSYASQYDEQWYIDTLWMVTEEARAEIELQGQTPEKYLDWRIDAMNETLSRSLVDSSIVRSLGVHIINDHDIARTGVDVGTTDVTISNALSWLGSYRDVYGADKVMIVAGTEEGASGAALGGGDVSAHWVTFLPVEHEFGHQMGASHCSEGVAGDLQFGHPASGYTQEGTPIEGGPVDAGTRMCGNSIALYSNPDVQLTLDEVGDMVLEGLAPDGDWAALQNEDGLIVFGDEQYANMAQQWRDVEEEAATKMASTLYQGEIGEPYEEKDCVALYSQEGYGGFVEEICAGDDVINPAPFRSIQVGSHAHANLYTDSGFGADSMCGGQLVRLSYSSPSLDALADHHGIPSVSDDVGAISVYDPDDREAHALMNGPYTFHGAGTVPSCEEGSEQELVLMPDNRDWTATAAVYTSDVAIPFAVDFLLRSYHETEDPPADGFVFFFGKDADSYTQQVPPREQQGFMPDGSGFGIMFNTWTSQVGLRDGLWNTLGTDIHHDSYTNGEWTPIRIEVRENGVVVLWNELELYRANTTIESPDQTVGFSAGTGYYVMDVRLKDIVYTPLQ